MLIYKDNSLLVQEIHVNDINNIYICHKEKTFEEPECYRAKKGIIIDDTSHNDNSTIHISLHQILIRSSGDSIPLSLETSCGLI